MHFPTKNHQVRSKVLTSSKPAKTLSQIKRSRLSAQNIPLTRPSRTTRKSAKSRNTNQVFSKIVKKYRPSKQTSDSFFQSKETISVDKKKSRSKTTKNPSSNKDKKKASEESGSNFEYQFNINKQKKNKSVKSHVPKLLLKEKNSEKALLESGLTGTQSLKLEKEDTENQNKDGTTKNKSEAKNPLKLKESKEIISNKKQLVESFVLDGAKQVQEDSKINEMQQFIGLLNKPELLNNPAELISNLPNQSSQGNDVNLEGIVANTTANVLKMLKENPKMAKEILGIKEKDSGKKPKPTRKLKKKEPEKNKKSGYTARFRKSHITSKMKDSYLSKKKESGNLTQRKTNNGITNRIKQNINQRYKVKKNIKNSYKKNLTNKDKYKYIKKHSKTARKSREIDNLKQELELINLENEEVIDIKSLKKEQGQELVEIFNSELLAQPQNAQTLNPSRIRKLKKIVQQIEKNDNQPEDIRAFESEIKKTQQTLDNKLTKTFDLGRPSGKNVYFRIDRLINAEQDKPNRSTTPKRAKDFLKRNKEFIKKKNEAIQRKLRKQQASKSQAISKQRKREILSSPVPSHSQVRGQRRGEKRKQQRELVASNLKKKFKGGTKWDPKGPKLPEKIKYTKQKTVANESRVKSTNAFRRSQTQTSGDEGHPALKYILKQFSNRHYDKNLAEEIDKSIKEFGHHEAEDFKMKSLVVQMESKEDADKTLEVVKKGKVLNKDAKKNKEKTKENNLQTTTLEDSSENIKQSSISQKEKKPKNTDKETENKNISSSMTTSNIEESNLSQMKPAFKSNQNSEQKPTIAETVQTKKEKKKMKNFSKENTVIKKEFKRKKSPFNCQEQSQEIQEAPVQLDTLIKPEKPKKKKLKKKHKKSKKSLIQNYMQDLELQSNKKIEDFEVSVRTRKSRKTVDLNSSDLQSLQGKLFKTLEPGVNDLQRIISIDKQASDRNSSTDAKTVQSFNELSNRDRIKLLLMSGEKMLFEKKKPRARSQEAKKKKKKKTAKKYKKKVKPKSKEDVTKKSVKRLKKKKSKQSKSKHKPNKSSNEIDLNDDRFSMMSNTMPLLKKEEEPRLCLPGPSKLDNSHVAKKVNKWGKKKKSVKRGAPKVHTPVKEKKKPEDSPWHSNTPIPLISKDLSQQKPVEESLHGEENNENLQRNLFYDTTTSKQETNESIPQVSAFSKKEHQETQPIPKQEISKDQEKTPPSLPLPLEMDSIITFKENTQKPEIVESELLLSDTANFDLMAPPNNLNFKKMKAPTQEIEISQPQIQEIDHSEVQIEQEDFIDRNLEPTDTAEDHIDKEAQGESHFDFATNDLEEEKHKMMIEHGEQFSKVD